jgi:hypothetical protein
MEALIMSPDTAEIAGLTPIYSAVAPG